MEDPRRKSPKPTNRRVAFMFACAGASLLVMYLTARSMSLGRSSSAADACVIMARMEAHTNSTLPRIVHLQWHTEEPANGTIQAATLAAFRKSFAGHDVRVWTDAKMRDFVSKEYPWFVGTYDAYPDNIRRVDSFRYFALHRFGGIYADMDFTPTRDFSNLLSDAAPSVVESPLAFAESVQNSLMSSPANHPFWPKYVFSALLTRRGRYTITQSTGTAMLSDSVAKARSDGVRIDALPCEVFFRLPPFRTHQTDLFSSFLFSNVLSKTRLVKNCGVVDLEDPCMAAVHYGTNTWVTSPFLRKRTM